MILKGDVLRRGKPSKYYSIKSFVVVFLTPTKSFVKHTV